MPATTREKHIFQKSRISKEKEKMKVEEALKRVKKIEKEKILAGETLELIIDNGVVLRAIEVPLHISTRKHLFR